MRASSPVSPRRTASRASRSGSGPSYAGGGSGRGPATGGPQEMPYGLLGQVEPAQRVGGGGVDGGTVVDQPGDPFPELRRRGGAEVGILRCRGRAVSGRGCRRCAVGAVSPLLSVEAYVLT